jgi:small-conductance mechanosensitive channel
LIQDILTREIVADRGGLQNFAVRLGLAYGNTWDRLVQLAGYHLFNIGGAMVTPSGIVKMLVILALTVGISWLIRFLMARGLSKKETAQSPAYYALGRILHYIIMTVGSFAALSSIGIDFTTFALIAGALSVGIGFGLQAIVGNFVSGLILLFEGTLRVGDYIELDSGLCGVVREINTRATVVNTNDSVDVVVPNSELVTTKLTNWTLRETVARVRIPFGVAYGSDKELVRRVALEAVREVGFALTNVPGRAPQVRLTSFGDSALEFDALIWVSRQGVRRPQLIRAEFLWALETLFRENNIEIPFPQRDVHVRSDFRDDKDQNAASDPVTDPSHV